MKKALSCSFALLLAVLAVANTTTFTFTASPSGSLVAGYKVYVCTNSLSTVSSTNDIKNTTTFQLTNIVPGIVYFVYVTAYDTNGLESLPSNKPMFGYPFAPTAISVGP